MRISIFIACLLPVFLAAQSKEVKWDGTVQQTDITRHLEILEDPTGKLGIDDIKKPENQSRFKVYGKNPLNLGYTESHFWLKFHLDNNGVGKPILELAQACLPVTEFYYVNDSGQTVKQVASYRVPVKEKPVPTHFQAFSLPAGSRDFYLRIVTNSGPIPVRIVSEYTFHVKTERQIMVYGAYLGFMLFLLIANLFFFFSLRNWLYLFYAFNVFIYACYSAVVVDGFIIYLFSKVDLMFWYTTIPTIGITVQILYGLLFLKVKKYDPKMYRIGMGFTIYFAVWAVLKFFFSFPIVQPINTLHALISFFLIGFIGVRSAKKGNRMGTYFAWAFFAYFGLVAMEATYINTGKPAYLFDLSYTALSTIVEAFILSFLLSKRFEWERAETEAQSRAAKERLLEKTLENEKLVREQNEMLEKEVARRTDELRVSLENVKMEKEKSEHLLLNILPAQTAQELKEKGKAIPKTHPNVSVLFTDFVDFTHNSENMSPEELVNTLHECYTAFDQIVRSYGLEKIKTIGDAYMAASGLTDNVPDHAELTIRAAMDMLVFMEKLNRQRSLSGEPNWPIRIGVNSGVVISGVVGKHKFSYDIWGDAVNTASRIESSGAPGRINISRNTYELVKDKFSCESRGKIDVKGKGEIEMFFVNGPDLSHGIEAHHP